MKKHEIQQAFAEGKTILRAQYFPSEKAFKLVYRTEKGGWAIWKHYAHLKWDLRDYAETVIRDLINKYPKRYIEG